VRFLDVRDPRGTGTTLGERSPAPGPTGIAVRRRHRTCEVEGDLSLVAVVGRGDFASRALASLSEAGVRPVEADLGADRPIQLFVVRAVELELAVRAVHAACFAVVGARLS